MKLIQTFISEVNHEESLLKSTIQNRRKELVTHVKNSINKSNVTNKKKRDTNELPSSTTHHITKNNTKQNNGNLMRALREM